MGVVTGSSPAFNGGTITKGVTVDGAIDETLLELDAVGGALSDALLIHADASDPVNTEFRVDRRGNLTIKSGGSFQEASIHLSDNTSGNEGDIIIDTFTGVILSPEGSSRTILTLLPHATHSGRQLKSTAVDGVTEMLAISSGGYLLIKGHAAPADGALAAGECALWFDQTDGAGKLMVKAKTANGTVATGSVTLS